MIVFLEGPDLAGKSTLASELSAALDIPTLHTRMDLTQPRASSYTLAATLLPVLEMCDVDVIFDRFFFSEYVYAQVLGREHDYLPELISRAAGLKRAHLLLVTADDDTLMRRYDERGDPHRSLDEVLKARDLYASLLDVLPPSITPHLLDTSGEAPRDTVRRAVECLLGTPAPSLGGCGRGVRLLCGAEARSRS